MISVCFTLICTSSGVEEEALSAFQTCFWEAPGDKVIYMLIFPEFIWALRLKGSFWSKMKRLWTTPPVAGILIWAAFPRVRDGISSPPSGTF